MQMTTELLDNAAFREAKRGGYNTQDVDEFIEQVKLEYRRHEAMLQEVVKRSEAFEARVAEAERRVQEAEQGAAAGADSGETLKRTLVLAQRTADAAVKEAEDRAAQMLASAQDQASHIIADAEQAAAQTQERADAEATRAHAEARSRVLRELKDLEAARDNLQADVDVLERHLADQRDRLGNSVRELQRLLDDPAALQPAGAPKLSKVVVPDSAPQPVAPPSEPAADEGPEWEPDPEEWEEPAAAAAPPTQGGSSSAEPPRGPDADDDAYLAELRKAMTDDAPLGPREEDDATSMFDAGGESGKSRFGRRR